MKNLSSIPRLSLFEAFTILITLAVCLAGFTEAEVHSNLRKQEEKNYASKEASNRENVPYSQKTATLRGGELFQQDNLQNANEFLGSSLEKLIKRHSDDFGESAESDSERENDGYGYDDDEYYHLNYKRNDDAVGNAESNKLGKGNIGELNKKEGISPQKGSSQEKVQKENEKEMQTIEMLNFKEFHPNVGGPEGSPVGNQVPNPYTIPNPKPYTFDSHKKLPINSIDALNMNDLKGNSAIEEKMKDRKDDSGGVLAAAAPDSKISESKKVKGEDKDSVKLKDAKIADESEKKEKEVNLKETKENVASKSLKDSAKNSEEKDKNIKLNDNAKLEENLEKMNTKSKEGETAKIAKDDKESSRLAEKGNADVINQNDISQISNRANFVSNDYKDNIEAVKQTATEDDEKTSEEVGEKNVGLSDYEEELREKQEKLRHFSPQENDIAGEQDPAVEASQESVRGTDYLSFPLNFEVREEGQDDYLKKREPWKDHGKFHQQYQFMQDSQGQMSNQQQQTQPQMGQQATAEHDHKNSYHLNFPQNELENTEYHKNFIKSLKRYKGLAENAKVLAPEATSFSSVDKNSHPENPEARKKKRSKSKKRRSMLSGDKDKSQSSYVKPRRNTYRNEDPQWHQMGRQDFETASSPKASKDNAKLFDNKKFEAQQENPRQRRKSPSKLEYEIKIINKNDQESKNAPFSANLRMKKDVKLKLTNDDKYLKKYPYSQVSRDDLTKLGEHEAEKKFKRKAPVWMRTDQNKETNIQTRGLPSGYYGNRVKFGQKSYTRNEEKGSTDHSSVDLNRMSYEGMPMTSEKNAYQRTWELQPDYKHDPMKRYDESAFKDRSGNSLLLIKKGQNGERIAKTFEEGNEKDTEEDTERLVKILSKDDDYLILKKTDTNKYRKITDSDTSKGESKGASYQKNVLVEGETQAKQSVQNKGVHTRSSHPNKEEKKYSSSFHSSGPKSNLKKTFDKFRDLADFFKDSEQESTDNQYPLQEVKEGRDIVFSEDKLPDPIVISSDGNGKADNLNQKPTNSIYSISTNFKHLDQQDRKEDLPKDTENSKNMLAAEVKSDSQEFSWEPALKNAFPEAKTINSMSKNGNEIIVLDFNRNQLKTDHNLHPQQGGRTQPLMGNWLPGSRLLNTVGQRQVEVMFPSKFSISGKSKQDEKNVPMLSLQHQDGTYTLLSSADGQAQIAIPYAQLAQYPAWKNIPQSKENSISKKFKSVSRKSAKWISQNKMSDNYKQFLRDLRELSDINKKGKRSTNDILLPGSSLTKLSTYGGTNVKLLGDFLQDILSYEHAGIKGGKQEEADNVGYSKNSENSYEKQWDPVSAGYDLRRQGQWSSSEVKNNEYSPLSKNKVEVLPADLKAEIENLLSHDAGSDEYQNKLWEELATASDTINRLRREGMGKRKLRKTIEEALRESRQSEELGRCPVKADDKCAIKLNSDAKGLNGKVAAVESKGEKENIENLQPKLKEEGSKVTSEQEKSLKSDYEGHLNDLFENLNLDKNQKDQLNVPNESSPNRRKRKDTHRRKRSSRRDVKNKVSTTEVQNRILKNLPEDNYPSVYSPGIKRRLLSTENEAEEADGYNGADEHDKSEIAEGGEANRLKNARNKCIDPMILELFGGDSAEGEKNRDRRSLASGLHSNFKREIDLDESMPNDFQNFLVTSLGGFGSQKREVVKKDEALWEGKESSQDNYNQIVENSPAGKEACEDSALEKREVPSAEAHKNQKYKTSNYFGGGADSEQMTGMPHAEKKVRSESKSLIGTKASEYDDKLPTQIRIQITNGSSKEKKSSKPIMEESETTSTDVESLPKEKEFFDKNKINQLGVSSSNMPKLRQFPKSKYSFADYEDGETRDAAKQKAYVVPPYRRHRRKKKKYVPENPMKPIKDFIAFDQKAMETLLRKYMADQNLANEQHTTQKIPMTNHLPQVETVYNPTQGTNKAQLEVSRLNKINSVSNKNSENVKNNLQSNAVPELDDGIMRSYLKEKPGAKAKSEKSYTKEYEEMDWKPFSAEPRLRMDNLREGQTALSFQNLKTFGGEIASSLNRGMNPPPSGLLTPFSQAPYTQKWSQTPLSNYFYHPPHGSLLNSNSFYDALKLKQEMKSYGMPKDRSYGVLMKDHTPMKTPQKPFYYYDGSLYNKGEDKDRNPNFPQTTAEPTWNYDYMLNKKPFVPKLKSREYYNSGMKSQVDLRKKARNKYMKTIEEEKIGPQYDTTQPRPIDSSKDTDYLDVLEDDYVDDENSKDSQFDDPVITDMNKKSNKLYDPATYHHMYNFKTSDLDDGVNDSDEEFDDDYDESCDDDDLDDYSLLANAKELEPEVTKNTHATAMHQSSPEDSFSHLSTFYPRSSQFEFKRNNFEPTEYVNFKPDEKFDQGRQTIPLVGLKDNLDPLASSNSVLKSANENSNIFGKNLMKNLNKYNYDETWRNPDKLQNGKPMSGLNQKYGRKLKRKMDWQRVPKRSKENSKIGSRIFYVAKTELFDKPESGAHSQSEWSSSFVMPSVRIPLTAQFATDDNDFDCESEEKGRHIRRAVEWVTGGDAKDDPEPCCDDADDVEDVTENLEDNGETISEDNVLENVIGKYIMRKRVKSSSLVPISDTLVSGHRKIHKRSVKEIAETKANSQNPRKMLRKRLSSGHLTENNFKKYHKKNLNGKRHIGGGDLTAFHGEAKNKVGRESTEKRKARGQKPQAQGKRSALDIFKKITNKDKDLKKAESPESRTAGFEPLMPLPSEKKSEISEKEPELVRNLQIKKLVPQEKNILPERKLNRENEPLRAKEGVSERKKEKSKVGPGLWKFELNGKLGNKDHLGKEKNLASQSEGEKNMKAYFVISENVRRAKRKFPGALPPAFGSSLTEVGTSYRPKCDAGSGIYKTHVRKRSLERTKTANEDASQSKASLTEPVKENPLTIQEHNRALHDTVSLSEGDSKPQVPHLLQRHSDKNGSFVTDGERNPRFLSKGKLTNLKSVFPPSSDANIIRDSRDINEEKSEYLGQQIVEAILSHVSANPKFKELIAPGLAMRTPNYKESLEDKRRTFHQMDFDEQMQSFLQKFMFDLEKLAEKHVKKRMCNKIDKQSKNFLQSLLSVPAGKDKDEKIFDNPERPCSSPEDAIEPPMTLTPTQPPTTEPPVRDDYTLQQEILDNLKRKQRLLKKLIAGYQNLSKIEKETLDVNYQYLLQELDQTNRNLSPLRSHPCLISPFSELCLRSIRNKGNQNHCGNLKNAGFETTVNETVKKCDTKSMTCQPPCEVVNIPTQTSPCTVSTTTNTPETTTIVFPTLYFEPLEDTSKNSETTTNKIFSAFESVKTDSSSLPEKPSSIHTFEQQEYPQSTAIILKEEETNEPRWPGDNNATKSSLEAVQTPSIATPQSFSLLPSQDIASTANISMPTAELESIRKKQSADGNSNENSLISGLGKALPPTFDKVYLSTELHKLNIGDAAGLQLSLKNRDPWVSTLDVAKSLRHVPTNAFSPQKDKIADSQPSLLARNMDALFLEDWKNPRSLTASENQYNPRVSYFCRPVFPYRLDKKFYIIKNRPFFRSKIKIGKPEKSKTMRFQYLPREQSSLGLAKEPNDETSELKDSVEGGERCRRRKKKKRRHSKRHWRWRGGRSREQQVPSQSLVPSVRQQPTSLGTGVDIDEVSLRKRILGRRKSSPV